MNIQANTKEAVELFRQGSLAFADIHENGFCVDVPYCEKQQKHLERRMKWLDNSMGKTTIGKEWRKKFGRIDWESDDQLRYILFDYLAEKSTKKTKKGNKSTDATVLDRLGKQHPMLKDLSTRRKLSKCHGTFLKGIMENQVDGVLHGMFSLMVVKSFRSSSSKPNFQNFPIRNPMQSKIIRRAFIPDEGNMLMEIDFSGAEVRVAACYHQDPEMIQDILDPLRDMHRDMAMECYMLDPTTLGAKGSKTYKNLRYCGKNKFVFPAFYGQYYAQLGLALWEAIEDLDLVTATGLPLHEHLERKGIRTYSAFEKHIEKVENDFWNRRYRVYNQWKKKWYKNYLKRGYFDSFTGFRYEGVFKRNQVINFPVQGSAFHCLLWSLIRLNKWLQQKQMDSCLIGQIHDSILGDVAPYEKDAYIKKALQIMSKDIQKEWKWLIVPLEVEVEATPINGSWYEKEEIKI